MLCEGGESVVKYRSYVLRCEVPDAMYKVVVIYDLRMGL